MDITQALGTLLQGQDLEHAQALKVFQQLFKGALPPSQAGALLMGLKLKGECAGELQAAVQAALEKAKLIQIENGKLIDTCGTGGDGKNSFNCSTAVALFLADLGYKVVKHGNRAISSSCGSADIIEALDIPFASSAEEAKKQLQNKNFTFLFAPNFHPAFAKIAPIRKELGIPTLFNLMGPLLNPARPSHQILGVGNAKYLKLVAQTLALTGSKRAAVVHGAGGFDELTPCGTGQVLFVEGKKIIELPINPQEYGIAPCTETDLACKNREEAISLMRQALQGKAPKAIAEMVALNLALALLILEEDLNFKQCLILARKKVSLGINMERLHA